MRDGRAEFERAMFNVYARAKEELGYNAARYLQMLLDRGGIETAKSLLHSRGIHEGFWHLVTRGRADLTVEYLVLRPEFQDLFTKDELDAAKARLESVRQ